VQELCTEIVLMKILKHLMLSVLLYAANGNLCQAAQQDTTVKKDTMNHTTMKIEIWSDVMCPFCYIGKRKLEAALQQFDNSGKLSIEWKSFQLDPSMKSEPGKSINQYLAERKGWTLDHARQMNNHVTGMAREVGLTYDFDKAVIGNSFDAHRLIQMAKQQGLGDVAEERLFKAYFTEGKDFADRTILVQLGTEIGLDAAAVSKMLESGEYADAVMRDIHEAEQIGVTGVPFFVFDRKYAISGAQPVEVFVKTLERSMEEWQQKQAPGLDISSGPACTPDGNCN